VRPFRPFLDSGPGGMGKPMWLNPPGPPAMDKEKDDGINWN